ncbi:MAG: molybdopterin-dependent oxidoreductase, partial [Deltaproteobacteria bacterium]|nr:molybdopterin-dependent oxidoreductase [Deltaproteobacteria bacterium]
MTNSISEIGDAACIFVIGSNATATHPIIGRQISRAIKRGAKLIAADPRRTEMRRMADIWMGHQPGTDVALLNAMARIIIEERLHDTDFIEKRCEGFEAFQESIMGPPLSMAETIT